MIKHINKNITKLKAFTMLEILMITLIMGIWLVSIVVAISKAKVITNNTKQHIIATQLAREGVEMVYQIRNTNLLKHPNNKNNCRLEWTRDSLCSTVGYNLMNSWNYMLTINPIRISNAWWNGLNIFDWIDSSDKIYSLILTGSQRIPDPGSQENSTKYGKFFRIIKAKWIYLKNTNSTWWDLIDCQNSNDNPSCNDNTAKEFRFCSRVEYIGTETWSVEICSVLTNFFD